VAQALLQLMSLNASSYRLPGDLYVPTGYVGGGSEGYADFSQ